MTTTESRTTAREYEVGALSDLTPGEGRTYTAGGRQIAVFLLGDDTVRALDAVCPHRGGPLADGQIDPDLVVCPLHQYAFRFDTGRCTAPGIDPVHIYPARVHDGRIVVTVG